MGQSATEVNSYLAMGKLCFHLIQILILAIIVQPSNAQWKKATKREDILCSDNCTKRTVEGDTKNVAIAKEVLSEDKFKELFPKMNTTHYTYKKLMTAISMFKEFCSTTSICKRHLAYMFAHFKQEVGGLTFAEEGVDNLKNSGGYTGDNKTTKTSYYYGRGAFQLSHKNNYKMFSKFVYNEKKKGEEGCCLMRNPQKVICDKLEFVSALWSFSVEAGGNMIWDEFFYKTI